VFLGTQVSPRASSRPRLTTTPLPPARSQDHLSLQGTFTLKQSPMLGAPRRRGPGRRPTPSPLPSPSSQPQPQPGRHPLTPPASAPAPRPP
jgi:hypothetical protein